MLQSDLDDKIGSLRIEKLMLIKSKAKIRDQEKILAIEKKIVIVNNEMKKLRNDFRKEKEKNNERN